MAKYSAQNLKTLLPTQIQITMQIKNDLIDIRYNYDDVNIMTPIYASNLLQNKLKNRSDLLYSHINKQGYYIFLIDLVIEIFFIIIQFNKNFIHYVISCRLQ
ncbi:unnamed protein product [Paramecium pentaurelia]|uniref:Uncharacterized protein n=1 Tax=Paramecium pentaurelia TaxID=43138 RepID=A0A8S1X4F6_9CILI|nr:unnamed protein product [Paramecium pentaurelia]